MTTRSPQLTMKPAVRQQLPISAIAYLLLIAGFALLVLGSPSGETSVLVVSVFLTYAGALFWCAADFRARYILAAFLGSFGLFLLARLAVYLVVDTRGVSVGLLGTNFTDEQLVADMLTLTTTSLLALMVGAILVGSWRSKAIDVLYPVPAPARVRAVALGLFYIAAPFVIFEAWQIAQTGQSVGFYEARLNAGSVLPAPLALTAGLAVPAFLAYLAALPSRRAATLNTAVFIVTMAFTLVTWQRSTFVMSLLIVAVYWVFRHYTAPPGERWIKVRFVLLGGAVAVVLMMLLALLNSLRGRTRALGLPGGPVVDFLFDQGVSINILGYTILFRDDLPRDRFYSFGQIIESFNAYVMPIFGAGRSFAGQTLERAAEGNQLSHTISYLVLRDDYLRGSGYGSSFIAELFVDGGIEAVIAGSLAFGVLLTLAPRVLRRAFFWRLLALALVQGVMFAPRGGFTQFLVQAVAMPNLVVYVAVLAAFILGRRDSEREPR